jgi:hypothetical protein
LMADFCAWHRSKGTASASWQDEIFRWAGNELQRRQRAAAQRSPEPPPVVPPSRQTLREALRGQDEDDPSLVPRRLSSPVRGQEGVKNARSGSLGGGGSQAANETLLDPLAARKTASVKK